MVPGRVREDYPKLEDFVHTLDRYSMIQVGQLA